MPLKHHVVRDAVEGNLLKLRPACRGNARGNGRFSDAGRTDQKNPDACERTLVQTVQIKNLGDRILHALHAAVRLVHPAVEGVDVKRPERFPARNEACEIGEPLRVLLPLLRGKIVAAALADQGTNLRRRLIGILPSVAAEHNDRGVLVHARGERGLDKFTRNGKLRAHTR